MDGRLYLAHRLAWLYATGAWPDEQFDHWDLDRSNNSWGNLRAATFQQQAANHPVPITNKSGFKGVSWSAQASKWQAHIRINGKSRFLGYWNTPERSFIAYVFAAWKHRGDYARVR